MNLAVLLVLLFALVLLANVSVALLLRRGGHRPFRLPNFGSPPAFGPSAVRIRGQALVSLLYVPWPFAVLTVDEDFASLAIGPVQPIVLDRRLVTAVQVIGVPGFSGVRFVSPDGRYDGVLFFTFSRLKVGANSVLDTLAVMGWPVSQ